jgi:8-oxo-dGTP pyrophosphatase MutT (NUDIX family)
LLYNGYPEQDMSEIEKTQKTLADLLPADMFIGTSLILREGESAESNRFLYGIRPVREESNRLILEVTGIGGGLEAEDSSPGAGAIREAQEEIACAVTLIPSSMTLLINGYNDISLIRVAGPERPLAIIYRHYKSPPHSPWHPYNKGLACLVLFLGKLEGRPRPDTELPNLIWLPSTLVLETARRDVPLGELLMAGAALVPGQSGSPALDGLARMTDSQEALALALGHETPSFYDGLFQGDFPEQLATLIAREEQETAYQEASGFDVADPAGFGVTDDEQTDSSEKDRLLAAGEAENKQSLEEQLSATRTALDMLRHDISEATTRIEHLIERTAKVESELGLMRKTLSTSRNRISRLLQRRRRRNNE